MIDAGANEIRSATDDLSRRTEQQAASVEETAAALEQVTTAVKDSASRRVMPVNWWQRPEPVPNDPARSCVKP